MSKIFNEISTESSTDKIFSEIEDNDVFFDETEVAGYKKRQDFYKHLASIPLEWALVDEELKDVDMLNEFLLHLQSQERSGEVLSKMPELFQVLIGRQDLSFAKAFYDIMRSHGAANQAIASTIIAYEDALEGKDQIAQINAGQILKFLTEERKLKISESSLDGRAALSYCGSEKTLINYFQDLGQPILSPKDSNLFQAAEEFDSKELQKAISDRAQNDVDIFSLCDELGRSIFDAAFPPAYATTDDQKQRGSMQKARILFDLFEQQNPNDYAQAMWMMPSSEGNLLQSLVEKNLTEVVQEMLFRGYCDLEKIYKNHAILLSDSANECSQMLYNTALLAHHLKAEKFSAKIINELIARGAYPYSSNMAQNVASDKSLEKMPLILNEIAIKMLKEEKGKGDINSKSLEELKETVALIKNLKSKGLSMTECFMTGKALDSGNSFAAVCILIANDKLEMPRSLGQLMFAVYAVDGNKNALKENYDDATKKVSQDFSSSLEMLSSPLRSPLPDSSRPSSSTSSGIFSDTSSPTSSRPSSPASSTSSGISSRPSSPALPVANVAKSRPASSVPLTNSVNTGERANRDLEGQASARHLSVRERVAALNAAAVPSSTVRPTAFNSIATTKVVSHNQGRSTAK